MGTEFSFQPLTQAMKVFTFSPVGSPSSNGMRMCVCGRNELEVCSTLAYPHISSFCAMPVLYTSTHTHTHPQSKKFEGSGTTGLKVDIALRNV